MYSGQHLNVDVLRNYLFNLGRVRTFEVLVSLTQRVVNCVTDIFVSITYIILGCYRLYILR